MFSKNTDIYTIIDMLDKAERNFSIHIDNTDQDWVVEVWQFSEESIFFHFDYASGKLVEIYTSSPGWEW